MPPSSPLCHGCEPQLLLGLLGFPPLPDQRDDPGPDRTRYSLVVRDVEALAGGGVLLPAGVDVLVRKEAGPQ
jgi:hypothetical protein